MNAGRHVRPAAVSAVGSATGSHGLLDAEEKGGGPWDVEPERLHQHDLVGGERRQGPPPPGRNREGGVRAEDVRRHFRAEKVPVWLMLDPFANLARCQDGSWQACSAALAEAVDKGDVCRDAGSPVAWIMAVARGSGSILFLSAALNMQWSLDGAGCMPCLQGLCQSIRLL